MPRCVVPIRPEPLAVSRSASRSRWKGRISGQFSAIWRFSGAIVTLWLRSRAISSRSAHGSRTTPLPISDRVPRTTPDGSSDSL
jgi:hypothetical protein